MSSAETTFAKTSSAGTLFDLPNAGSFGRRLDGLAARIDRSRQSAGYVMHRLLLVNYWHFDEEEIVMPHGRLFLLGENGSGKSTILGATLPLLLDGSIRPERLDTFGSTQRKIDHYVLGQRAGGAAHQRRTSYVALEFAWCDPNRSPDDETEPTVSDDLSLVTEPACGAPPRYLTIGVCLAGNADAQETVRAHRFVITSGARLGTDILFKDKQGRVYDASYFRNQVREHGVITERQIEYRDLVAHHLFGFANFRTLEHLVEVLLLLRRPGLSNEIHTFADVYEYLKRALPALPDEITEQTTEAFARIDELRHREARLQGQADACAQMHAADLALALARARQRALPVLAAENGLKRRQLERYEKERALAAAEVELVRAETRHAQVERELTSTRQVLVELAGSALAREAGELEERLQHLENEHELIVRALTSDHRTRDDQRRDQGELQRRLADRERNWRQRHASARRSAQKLTSLTREGHWLDGEKAIDGLRARLADHDLDSPPAEAVAPFSNITEPSDLDGFSNPATRSLDGLVSWLETQLAPRIEERRARLEHLAGEVTGYEQAVETERQAESRRRARDEEVTAEQRAVVDADRALGDAWAHLEGLLKERQLATAVDLGSNQTWQALLGASARREREALADALTELEREAHAASAQDATEQQRLSQDIGQLRQSLATLDREIARIQAEPDLDLPRPPHRERARLALRAAGLEARPLYTLIDFAPDLAPERRGQIERALDDAGLLDALVLRDADIPSAEALLNDEGLADCRLVVDRPAQSESLWQRVLVVDPTVESGEWRAVTERLLHGLADVAMDQEHVAVFANTGRWRHGLLVGQAGRGDAAGFIGAANRRERRQREIDRLGAERDSIDRCLADFEGERDRRFQAQRRRQAALTALRKAADDWTISTAEVRLHERTRSLERAAAAAREASEEHARRAAERSEREDRMSALALPLLTIAKPNGGTVQTALRTVDQLHGLCALLGNELGQLASLQADQRQDRARLAEVVVLLEAVESAVARGERERLLKEEEVRRARALLESGDVRAFQRQRDEFQSTEGQLSAEQLELAGQIGSSQQVVATLAGLVHDLGEAVRAAEDELAGALEALAETLRLNPDVVDDGSIESDDDALVLARRWCGLEVISADQLARSAEQAREHRRAVFDERRGELIDYNLVIAPDERDRVVAQLSLREELALPALLDTIRQQVRDSQLLLNDEEERLFKDYLCDTGLSAIHQAVQEADKLVWRINEILDRTRLGRERYELKLETAVDRTEDSSPLARHHLLFRKDPAAVSDEERRVLFEAVRGAVAEARRRFADDGGVFADHLARAFDYREWYTLQLYVTDENGQRMRISSRTARARSGAQQLFALYVPLLAALAALYHAAQPWAPRLFAMDEAFDKVSEDNVTLLLRFLVDLDFQWIVASPRLSGAGRDVLPACADWQLYHDAIEQLAQAIPLIYFHGERLEAAPA